MPIPQVLSRFLNNYAIFVILLVIIIVLRINAVDTQQVFITINVQNDTEPDVVKNITNTLQNNSATFFLTANWARANENLTRQISLQHEIGCYTTNGERLIHLKQEALEQEITVCKNILENITQKEILGFRAPRHDLAGEAIPIVAKNFAYDSSAYKRYEWFWEPLPENVVEVPITSFLLLPLDDRYGHGMLKLSDIFYTLIRHTKQETVVVALDANRVNAHLLDLEYLLATYKHKNVEITTVEKELREV